MEKNKVSAFYDEYIKNQIAQSYNERHKYLYNSMLERGLKTDSNVLELGCGIGVITSLINKTVKKGKIVSVDISEDSINHSKKHNVSENIELIVSDLALFEYKPQIFQYIVLFDILEHVPQEHHESIFKKIYNHMDSKSKLIIHIPTKEIIKYSEINCPELMQIIDQPLCESELINKAKNAGLRLEEFKYTNIWDNRDYELFVFTLPFEFVPNPVATKKSFFSFKK